MRNINKIPGAKKTDHIKVYLPLLLLGFMCLIPQFVTGRPPASDKTVQDIIKASYGYNIGKVKINKVAWFDLASKGSNTDFYTVYNVNSTTYIDVFTPRSGLPENLYHECQEFIGEDMNAYHAVISNKTFFISSMIQGSSSSLDISIYEYDGIGKLRLVNATAEQPNTNFPIISEGHIHNLFEGSIHVADNRIFLAGNSQKYELKYTGNSFIVTKYRQRISCGCRGSHVLASHLKDGTFSVTYDGQEIAFKQTHKPSRPDTEPECQLSVNPIVLRQDDLIIIDDNMEEPTAVKWFIEDPAMFFSRGFFSSIRPKIVGKTTIRVYFCYQTQYDIEVLIEKGTELL